jgi:4-hydroxybenzoate polyprenyltransferase
MSIAKRLFDFYLNASLHIGLAILALARITEISLKIPSQINLNMVIFSGAVVGYNVLKYIDVFTRNRLWISRNSSIILVSVLAFLIASFYFLQLETTIQLAFIGIGVIIGFYPFLRKFGLLKMFLVSFCIALITVGAPFFMKTQLTIEIYLTFLQRFLIVISLLIPFEIYDSKTDDPTLLTLPQQFGIRPTKIFGMLLVIPFLLLEFFKTNPSYSVLIVSIITVLFIHFSSIHKSKYYTSFWVESVPIFWWFLLLFINS